MKNLIAPFLAVCGICAVAAPKDPLAEGFPYWEGLEPRASISGRLVTSSDLRHKVAMVIEVDCDDKFKESMLLAARFAGMNTKPSGHVSWELMKDEEFPRDTIMLVSVFGKKPNEEMIADIASDKKLGSLLFSKPPAVLRYLTPVYYNVRLGGVDYEDLERKRPYAYVFSHEGGKPVWEGSLDEKKVADVRKAIAAARKKLPKWKVLTGIEDISKLPAVAKSLEKGKMKAATAAAIAAIKSKDPETSKQGQIVYDAIEQYKSDLVYRILVEAQSAPVRALADVQRLVKMFPQERRRLAEFEGVLSKNRDLQSLGKMMEKVLQMKDPSYNPKPAQLKKDLQLLNRWKRSLKGICENSNTLISGQAMLVTSLLDELASEVSARVGEK